MQEVKTIGNTNKLDVTSEYSITDLPAKMQRFVHLYTTGQYTLVKLAELLEVHPNTCGNWLKRKDVKALIADLQESTHDIVGMRLKSLSLNAAEKMSKLMNSPIDGVAYQAARDVLDRTGHRPKQEIKVDKTVTTYEEKLKNLIDDVIDVTEYEVSEVEEDETTS